MKCWLQRNDQADTAWRLIWLPFKGPETRGPMLEHMVGQYPCNADVPMAACIPAWKALGADHGRPQCRQAVLEACRPDICLRVLRMYGSPQELFLVLQLHTRAYSSTGTVAA